MKLALSTMYAQQPRFASGEAFAEYAAEAGYDGIEVSHSTPEAKLREILDSGILPVVSIHQPAPLVEVEGGKSNHDLNLASTKRSEHARAVRHALRSLEWAAEAGAAALVVHLGHVEGSFAGTTAEVYRLFRQHDIRNNRAAEARAEMEQRRAEAAPAHLEAARAALEQLVEAARPHGIVIGIENRLEMHQIPLPDESLALMEGLSPDEVGHWHDTGHGEVLARLGYLPHATWFDELGDRLVGAHVHDVRGVIDHRAPGTAQLDWQMVAGGLGSLDTLTLEIDQRETDEDVRAAPAFLRSVGLG
ncbi:MAG: sugar phosphate isomerase/epimerase [Dehalococcoidia bacterium]|nr:sugar phosphate isomerase/epimerase [Dehalococcoidia bacterium]MYA54435.1 sugar phosphate isomerase/epimerase [Dehalococcoidia bacterium]